VLARVDADSQVPDTDRTNNDAAATTIRVEARAADLAVASGSVVLPTTAIPGDSGRFNVNIANLGNIKAAGNIGIDIYASVSGVVDGNAVLVASLNNVKLSLSANHTYTYSVPVTLPSLPAATYHWIAVIDSHNVVDSTSPSVVGPVAMGTTEFVWKFGNFNNRRNVVLHVTDASSGLPVTFRMYGNGFGSVLGGSNLANDDIAVVGTNKSSQLVISTPGPEIQVNNVTISQPIGRFVAPKLEVNGVITLNGATRFITLNDTLPYTAATNLGTITIPTTVVGVSSGASANWYKFTLASTGDANSKIRISFTGASGQVRAAIYSNPAKSQPIVSGVDATNLETIDLNGLVAGTYYLRVFGSAAYSYSTAITPL
jgi:hypothetical protein